MAHHYVIIGGPEHKQVMGGWSGANWTINKNAHIGDRVVFYLTAPIGAFVATGVVASNPKYNATEPWAGHFVADIGALKMLSRDLLRKELISKFPTWGYIKMPIKSLEVPDGIVPDLEKLISAALTLEDDDEEGAEVQLGTHIEFKSKTQRKLMTGVIKEIDEENDTYLVLRDNDLKKECIGIDKIKAVLGE